MPVQLHAANRRSRHQQVGGGIGAGLEYEYNYMGFGTRDLQFTTALSDGTPPFTEDVRDHINVVKAGINYWFH